MCRILAVLILTALGAATRAASPDTRSMEAAAHDVYFNAINSNDLDTLMADLTDDVVYQAPGEPEIVGKTAVRTCAAADCVSTHTHWKKISTGFTVNGDWAFERYRLGSADTDRKTGAVTHDAGKGINVFRRGSDARWRAAVNGGSSDCAGGS